MKLVTYTIIILPVFLFAQFLHANSNWPTSPDSGLVIGYGNFPQIISDRNGGAIVTFWANTPTQAKVKRVDQYGYLQWNGFSGVVAGGSGLYQEPETIIEDGRGGCFVAFKDVFVVDPYPPWVPISSSITVQRIDHYGNKLWGNGVQVSPVDSIIQAAAELQPDGQGGCILSWYDTRNVTDPYNQNSDIYAQRLDSLGSRCWGDSAIRISDTTMATASANDLQVDNEGNSYVRWGSQLQKMNIYGTKLWPEEGINLNHTPVTMSIIHPQNGIVFAGDRYDYSTATRSLLCQYYDSSGQKQWGDYGVTLADSVIYAESRVTELLFDNNNNLLVSYFFTQSGQPDTYLQKLAPDGTKLFGEVGVHVSVYPSKKRGSMFPSQNSIFVYWYDINQSNYQIQKLDYFGNILWSNDILFSTDGGGPVTTDSYGGLIMVYRKTGFSINLKKISKNGILGEVITSIQDRGTRIIPENFILYQNYPNPFNPVTHIKYQLPKASQVNIDIYNILGQRVRSLVNRQEDAEYYTAVWNGLNDNGQSVGSGIYIYRIVAKSLSDNSSFVSSKKMLMVK